MEKPNGWDNTEAKQFSSNEKPKSGAYVMKIVQASSAISGNKRPMMVYMLDIAQGPFAGNYKDLFEFLKKSNPAQKWPCIMRRCTDGDQLEYFKGDIKAIEESNANFKFNFDESTLKNKLVGCMLGEKEIDANGKTILEPRWFCSTEKAMSGEMKVPAVKKFVAQYKTENSRQPGQDEELPF